MSKFPEPNRANSFLAGHVVLLRNSLNLWADQDLIDPELADDDAARALFFSPFAVVSHNTESDPIFDYANKTALDLFEMTWDEFTKLPSRLSAEPINQAERARLLREVSTHGIIHNYSGVRLSRSGLRFLIEDGIVWNLQDNDGSYYGQAATFSHWKHL
jgi:hypothetical protein